MLHDARTAVTRTQRTQRLAVILFLLQGVALIPLLLTASQRDLKLGAALLEIQAQRHNREPRLHQHGEWGSDARDLLVIARTNPYPRALL